MPRRSEPRMHESLINQSLIKELADHGLVIDQAAVAERLQRYQPIIAAVANEQRLPAMNAGSYWASYSRDHHVLNPLLREFDQMGGELEELLYETYYGRKLRGSALVDVGAGQQSYMRRLARLFKVRVVVEIDKWYANLETGWNNVSDDSLAIVRLRQDMLAGLALLPDNSANVVMNGIEHCITANMRAYRDALFEEIKRVVPSGGIFFGHQSDVLEPPSGFTKKTFPDNPHTGPDGKFFSFEKED